ncbi:MAG: DUF421 domain-containing protein [Gammaproteobacteria bacterium]|jgi:uncharacterized membrane protein YcaP (DUF421 family)|nr:DUF421 domain-containing protein [Gammaproteobacteria bacterium]
MESIARALIVYAFMLLVFRFSGKRTLGEVTTFDFVLVLIVAETIQEALIGRDLSMTNAMIVIVTLIGIDIILNLVKAHSERADRLLEGTPTVIVENGQPLHERLREELIDEDDILHAARTQGLERMDQIKRAVLEPNGGISIIPRKDED